MSRILFVAAAAAALALSVAAPAQAGADRKPRPESSITPEAEAAGVQLAHQLFTATKWETFWVRKFTGPLTAQKTFGIKREPGWEGPLWEAVAEEFAHDRPALEQIAGREFARGMPLDQLKANVAFIDGPDGQTMLRSVFTTEVRETPLSDASLQLTGYQIIYLFKQDLPVLATGGPAFDDIKRFLKTHEGQSLLVLLQRVETRMEKKMLAELKPGVVERFNAKMQVVRDARAGAEKR